MSEMREEDPLRSWTYVAAVLLAIPAISAYAEKELDCQDVLRYGVFDEYSYASDTQIKKRFEQALCSTNFESHQDARSFGLGVGVPVYGVPVQVSGTFDEASKKEWFSKNCSATASKDDFRQFIANHVRTASPKIVEAWSACISAQADLHRTGLKCGVARPGTDIVFSAHWAPAYKDDPGPNVSLVKTFGGKCDPLKQPQKLTSKLAVKCSRPSEKETVSFLVETESDRCLLVVPGFSSDCTERRFKAADNGTDKNTFSANTDVNCQRILFEAGSVVRVRNGVRLRLMATDSIAVVGDGGAAIDGSGERGADGKNGPDRGDEWSSQGDGDFWKARNDVAGNDSHPDRGNPGKTGDQGGSGATIIFSKIPSGTLTCKVDGGEGGNGGRGGRGKLLKNGRNNYCNGCMYDRPGPDGGKGPPGDPGICSYLEREQKGPPDR